MRTYAAALALGLWGACGTTTNSPGFTTGGTTGGDATGGTAAATGGESGTSTGGTGVVGGTGGAGTGTGGAMPSGGASGTGGRIGGGGGGGPSGTGGRVGSGGRVATGGAIGASGGAGGAAAGLIFVGDFETGTLSQWNYIERCQPDRITVYSTANAPPGAPAPRQGQYAARFRVLDGDVAPCTSSENPRAELETVESLFKPGDDRWEAWSVYVPDTNPAPNTDSWFVFQEDYGAPWDGSPAIGWTLDLASNPNHFRLDRSEQYNHDQPGVATLVRGRWIDFLVHKKFANTVSGGGLVEAWVDKAPMTFSTCGCTTLATQTMRASQATVGFYLTSYRARGLLSSFDIYYDAVRIGTTRAAVELP